MHTCIHAYMHEYIHTYMRACVHASIHASIHTHIHTYGRYRAILFLHLRQSVKLSVYCKAKGTALEVS